jgi:hypothetical protein
MSTGGQLPPGDAVCVSVAPRTRFGRGNSEFRKLKKIEKFEQASPESGTESRCFSFLRDLRSISLVRMKDNNLNLVTGTNVDKRDLHSWQKGYWMRCELCDTVVEGDLESEIEDGFQDEKRAQEQGPSDQRTSYVKTKTEKLNNRKGERLK